MQQQHQKTKHKTVAKQHTVVYIASNYSLKLLLRLFQETIRNKSIQFELVGYPGRFGKAWLYSRSVTSDCVVMSDIVNICSIYPDDQTLLDVPLPTHSDKTHADKRCLFSFSVPVTPLLKFLSDLRVVSPIQLVFRRSSDTGRPIVEVQNMNASMVCHKKCVLNESTTGKPTTFHDVTWPVMNFRCFFRTNPTWLLTKLKSNNRCGNNKSRRKEPVLLCFVQQNGALNVMVVNGIHELLDNPHTTDEKKNKPNKEKGQPTNTTKPSPPATYDSISRKKPPQPTVLHTNFLVAVEGNRIKQMLKQINKSNPYNESIVTIKIDASLPLLLSVNLGNASSTESCFTTIIAPKVQYSW